MIHLESHSEEQTRQLSCNLGKLIDRNCCIALQGTLGAGKTCFVQGIALGLDISSTVVSPTFSIVHELSGRIDLLHSDLYRIEENDLLNLGLEEMFEDFEGVVIVEWADKFPELLPLDTVHIRIEICEENRKWYVSSTGPVSRNLITNWHKEIEK
jgi:tRNA threonylcarbamoyladenosine biosynthesis protein TsaE